MRTIIAIIIVLPVVGVFWWHIYQEAGLYTACIIAGIVIGNVMNQWRFERLSEKLNKTTSPFDALKQSRANDPDRKDTP